MEISPLEFKLLQNQPGVLLLDVRQPDEFTDFHVRGAVNIPLGEITAENISAAVKGHSKVYTICHSGKRSLVASQKLKEFGIDSLSVAGGTVLCAESGLDIVFAEE